MQGVSSKEFQEVLGYGGSDEIVHRDNISMVTLRNPPALGVALGGSASSGNLAEAAQEPESTRAEGDEPSSNGEDESADAAAAPVAASGVLSGATAAVAGLAAGATAGVAGLAAAVLGGSSSAGWDFCPRCCIAYSRANSS